MIIMAYNSKHLQYKYIFMNVTERMTNRNLHYLLDFIMNILLWIFHMQYFYISRALLRCISRKWFIYNFNERTITCVNFRSATSIFHEHGETIHV